MNTQSSQKSFNESVEIVDSLFASSTYGSLSKDKAIELFNNHNDVTELVAIYPDKSESVITNINDLYYYLDNNFEVIADFR